MRGCSWRALLRVMFQSAPAIAGGRCSRPCPSRRRCRRFNPRPPLLAGDAWVTVSPSAGRVSFNPRPPLLAGDAKLSRARGRAAGVSIRARHCWRAMRHVRSSTPQGGKFQSAPAIAGGRCRAPCARPGTPCQFQSAPAIAGGRCGDTLNPPRTVVLFQSAPAIAGGRCANSRVFMPYLHCFNPRPPLLAGDAR